MAKARDCVWTEGGTPWVSSCFPHTTFAVLSTTSWRLFLQEQGYYTKMEKNPFTEFGYKPACMENNFMGQKSMN